MRKTTAGQLRERVRVERATAPRDTVGQPQEGWAAVATVFARVEGAGGGEVYSADQTVARRVYTVTVRRPLDVGEKDRLVWVTGRNLILNVAAVDDSDRAFLSLTCVADADVRGA